MAYDNDDDRYDDDLSQDDGFSGFDDDEDDDNAAPARGGLKSQINNPYSASRPAGSSSDSSSSGRTGGGLRADEVRREYNPGSSSSSGSSASPFRSGASSSGGGSNYGSSSSSTNRPSGQGSSSFSSGGSGSSSSSGSRPSGSGSPYSSGGSGGSGSGSSSSSGSRPSGSGSPYSSGGSSGSGSGSSSSSGSRPSGSGSPYSSGGSSGSGSGSSSSTGSRPISSGSPYSSGGSSGSSSSSGNRTGGFQSSSSSASDRSGAGSSASSGSRDKKDDKSGEGGGFGAKLGGLTSKAGGFFKRDKDDSGDKKPAPRKDDKPAGEGGGIGAKFGGFVSQAKSKLNRGEKDAPKSGPSTAAPGRPGAPSSSSRPGGAKPAEAEGGGRFAAVTSRFSGVFKRGEKADAPPASTGSRPGGASPSSSSGARSTGSNPISSASPRAQAVAGGAASATRQASSRGGAVEAEPRGGIWEGMMRRMRGTPKPETQPQSRTRRESNTRVPELDTSGWSLDTKLDLVGIGLMLFSLIMLLTSASGDQGQMMGAVNRFVGQIFGWGAVAVPMMMGGVGVFLLVTRFGDDPPEIDVVRFAGALSGYLALLTLFQFIVVLDPIFGSGDLGTLKLLVEGLTWQKGLGGGFIGGQLHLFLIENIGEIGGFVLLLGWLAVSAMLITRTSATQLVVIVVSLYRSFRVSTQHRQQRRSAERTLAAQAQSEQQARIAISRPAAPELKPGIAGALSSGDIRQQPLPINEEPIPIRLGGQLVTAAAAPQAASPLSQPNRTGAIGGLLKRLPGRGANGGTQSDPASETAPTGGLRGFISRRSSTAANPAQTPAAHPAAAFAPPPSVAPPQSVPVMGPPPTTPPVAQPASAYTPPQTAAAPSPYAPPAASSSQQPVAQPTAPPSSTPLFNPGQVAAERPGVRQMHDYAPAVANNTVITPPRAPSIETVRAKREYTKPDYTQLLAPGAKGDYDRKALIERSRVIAETLESFGAPGKVVEINTGPVITQFGVEPGYVVQRDRQSRVKVSAIAQLDKDLQLALGARSIRIEAPVPGKGYVGIEVPNDTPMTVSLRDLMDSPRYKRIQSPLALAFGEAVDGTPVAADLTGMPHLLIAGTTGSGKSVMVNAIICALMLRNTPDDVRFIMVDPKRVELTGYNGIPHLVAPVVVDVERIIGVLKWVTREMDDRYKKFSVAGARNIDDYNRNRAPNTDKMPYIVVIIDELADLMMLAPEEAERYITRVAAMARATGIHLVIATQRPSADVVTGLIKANFPARIAFAVASNVDSRVILDQPGAEKLLGRGDMLYLSGDSPAPQRLQGVFVSDKEIQGIVAFWKQQGDNKPSAQLVTFAAVDREADSAAPSNGRNSGGNTRGMATGEPVRPMRGMFDEDDDADSGDDSGEEMPDDELYNRAVELVRRQNGASVSLLQRKMRIGYARAARLIDAMEDRGIVGPSKEGSSKQRDVLPPSLSGKT